MNGTVILKDTDLMAILLKHFERDGVTGVGNLTIKAPGTPDLGDFKLQITLTDEKVTQ